MSNNGLRTQFPYAGDALSPRAQFGFPSPTSNYPSGVDAPSPSFFPMAYQISPRFGTSAFIPPPDVFVDGRRETVRENGMYTPRNSGKRGLDALNTDPVAMHLLVETAIGDSQQFDILTVEEVDALKQEQKVLDTRLATVRRKLETETKIRDATRSLGRLAGTKGNGHKRGLASKGSNPVPDYDAKEQEGLESSNRKVEEFIRECLEIESRMRMIDMQLLMHTAAVLQLTHKGPKQREENDQSEDRFRRPDSPASLDTYDDTRLNGMSAGAFDERSLYRTPENLDNLMTVLQNGTHHQPERSNQAFGALATRLQEMNERLRNLIIEANPERDEDYSLPPLVLEGTLDASTIDRQLDFLDQGIRNISVEQANIRTNARQTLSEVEGRLENINNQLYSVVSRSENEQNEKILPPPAINGNGSTEQLNYMEDTFYNLEQIQFAMAERIKELGSGASMGEDSEKAEKYESTIKGLWDMIQTGEEQALERKRERRRLLAEDPDADEQLSPDEDFNSNEQYSLLAFSSKIQFLFKRATSLKEKQSVLLRQIKQQRELNSKSDAQKEADFERLNTQILSARSEKKSMEDELERAMSQLSQFDAQKGNADTEVLRGTQERNAGLEAQLINVQERVIAFESELKEAKQRVVAYENQLKDVQEQAVNYQSKLQDAEKRAASYEEELKDHQQRNSAYNVSSQEAEERTAGYEAQVRDAQERALMLEKELREARGEGETLKTQLAELTQRTDQATAALQAVTAAKEASEARSLDATNMLNAKEEEFRKLEGEIVRLTTELTFAKAELDGAYGTRAQRAADSAANPAIKKELDELADQNQALRGELEALRKVQDVASQSEAEARQSERNLKAELSAMAAEYEALTRDAIANEKDRDALESQIDKLRDDKEALERELSDEKVKWLGIRSPGTPMGTGSGAMQLDMGATSIRMLREDFRKMMRDRTAEGLKALRAEQEERRKLEAVVRQLRKESLPQRSNLSRTMTTPH